MRISSVMSTRELSAVAASTAGYQQETGFREGEHGAVSLGGFCLQLSPPPLHSAAGKRKMQSEVLSLSALGVVARPL